MFFTLYQCVIHFVKEKRGREQIRDAGGALERNDTAVVAAPACEKNKPIPARRMGSLYGSAGTACGDIAAIRTGERCAHSRPLSPTQTIKRPGL